MKKIIITIVLGLIAATAVGVWYFKGVDTSVQGATDTMLSVKSATTSQVNNPEQIKGKGSILSLLGLGKSMECTFVFSGEGLRGEGTGFFANSLSRIDTLYTGSSTENMSSYMIIDSGAKFMYSWFTKDGKTQGVKMSTETTAQINTPTDHAAPTQVDPDSAVQYDCKPWQADTSVFVPPADVKFMDMTNMKKKMEDMQKGMGTIPIPEMP